MKKKIINKKKNKQQAIKMFKTKRQKKVKNCKQKQKKNRKQKKNVRDNWGKTIYI